MSRVPVLSLCPGHRAQCIRRYWRLEAALRALWMVLLGHGVYRIDTELTLQQTQRREGWRMISFHEDRCAWLRARARGLRMTAVLIAVQPVVSESSRLHLKVRVTAIVCRCAVLNSLKMHFRVTLKRLPH